MRRQQQQDLALTWYGAALRRAKKLPSLLQFTGAGTDADAPEAQSRHMEGRLRAAFRKVGIDSR